MSLFVPQQSLPFQTVIRFLQLVEPGATGSPDEIGQQHASHLNVGDIIFTYEPIYSVWGDPTSGIGIADGDTFKISQMAIIFKKDAGELMAYVVSNDIYEVHSTASFIAKLVEKARTENQGVYYVVARPPSHIVADRASELAKLDRYGASGWRSEDAQVIDVSFAFFQSFGLPVDAAPGENLDYQSMAFLWIVDREAPAGVRIVDLRGRFGPVAPFPKSGDSASATESAPAQEVGEAAPLPQIPPSIKAPSRRIIPAKPSSTQGQTGSNRPIPVPVPKPGAPGRPVPPKAVKPGQRTATPAPAAEAPVQEVEPVAPEIPAFVPPPSLSGDFDMPSTTPTGEVNTVNVETSPIEHKDEDTMALAVSEFRERSPEPAAEEAPAQPEDFGIVNQPPPEVTADIPQELETTVDIPLPPTMKERAVEEEPAVEPVQDKAPEPVEEAEEAPQEPVEEEETGLAQIEETIASLAAATDKSGGPRGGATPPMPGTADTPTKPAPQPNRPYLDKETLTPTSAADLAAQLTAVARAADSPAGPTPSESIVLEKVVSEEREEEEEEKVPAPAVPPPQQVVAPPPKKKRSEHDARAQELQNRHVKEQVAVKSGVAGLVSKLEQQASKASAKLEVQVDESQSSLSRELESLLEKVSGSEERSVKTVEGLRQGLSAKLEEATSEVKETVHKKARTGCDTIGEQVDSGKKDLDQKYETLKKSLEGTFESVRTKAESLSGAFEENSNTRASQSMGELKELMEKIQTDFEEVATVYQKDLAAIFDHFKIRLSSHTTWVTDGLDNQYRTLDAEVEDLHHRSREQIKHLEKKLNEGLGHSLVESELGIIRVQSTALADNVIPRLREHRETLRALTAEFQKKTTEDLERKGDAKIDQFEPMTSEKKQQLNSLLGETMKIKQTIEDRQRREFEDTLNSLCDYIETSVEQAKTMFRETEDRIAEIDKAVRLLADPSNIESDLELLDERNNVLVRMDESTERYTDEVTNTLRTKLAALEERGKQLQEELISGMEEDAYLVRRSSEQALNRLKEAIKDAFASIQSAQDAHME